MAESAVSLLVNLLSTLLSGELDKGGGLREETQLMRDELEQIRAFLRVADAKEDIDTQLQVWVKQVREVAYDGEDLLDEFVARMAVYRQKGGFCGLAQKIYGSIRNFRAHRRLASKLRSIRARLGSFSEDHQRYRGIYGNQDCNSYSVDAGDRWHDTRGDALLLQEDDLVGIEEPKQQLIYWLLSGDLGQRVHAVVGMGGVGKTTLVKRVYKHEQVKQHFEHSVWITVSESFRADELLKDVIRQLSSNMNQPPPMGLLEGMNRDGLKAFIDDFLRQKTYLIVLDDVWDINAWEAIKYAFPRSNCGSRIIITSRFDDIGRSATNDTGGSVYVLNPLNQEDSWTLFCKKAFPRSICPPDQGLEEISRNILKGCEGLPLAIVVIGSVLATKNNNIQEWEMFHRSLGAELERNSRLENMTRLLSLSYYDLPYYLKFCLLYLSIFPEDAVISKMRLIRLWVAEGFVQEQRGKTIEEVGECYFNELVSRSLIQVVTAPDETPTACRIHDIIRQIILSKSEKQNVATIASDQQPITRWPEKVRRLAIHDPIKDSITPEITSRSFKYLRSIVLSGPSGLLQKSFLCKVLSQSSRLLKVLDLRGANIETVPGEVFELFHLSYLSLRGTNVKSVPKSIEKLQNLETLDLKGTHVTRLPVQILSLQRLRHLLVYRYGPHPIFKPFGHILCSLAAPYEIGRLNSLQKLCYIEADRTANCTKTMRELGKLTQLRRLGIAKLKREDGEELCSSLQRLTNLRSLILVSVKEDETLDLEHPLSSSPQFLRTLELKGLLQKLPQWVTSLHSLTKVRLRWTRLKEDPLPYLQDLPNLIHVRFNMAYEGETLYFKTGGFLKLKLLHITRLQALRRVNLEDGAMPLLHILRIRDCKLVKEVPSGIELLRNLHLFELSDMDDALVTPLKSRDRGNGDYCRIAHIPKIVIGSVVDQTFRGSVLERETERSLIGKFHSHHSVIFRA